MLTTTRRSATTLAQAAVAAASLLFTGSAIALASPATGGRLFTAFQNGVGSQGEPSTDGNTDSTIVEFTASGHVLRQWDITGKCDGLTADPARHLVIATVNEDANSSVYTIMPDAPAAAQIRHFHYNRPLPHKGGTDAISVYHGLILVSASAPGTTGKPAPQPIYPAIYVVRFNRATHVATISPLFGDDPFTGHVTRVPLSGATVNPKGLLFVGHAD